MKNRTKFHQLTMALRLATLIGAVGWTHFNKGLASPSAVFYLLGGFFLYSVACSILILTAKIETKIIDRVLLYLDMLFITLLVSFTGGWESPFYLAYFLLVALHAFSGGMGLGLNVAVGSSLLYLVTNFSVLHENFWGDMVLRLSFLFLVAVALGLVAQELNKRSLALQRKLAQITSLYRVSQNMTKSTGREEMLEKVIDDTMEITGASAAVILLAENGDFTKIASRGLMFAGNVALPSDLRRWVVEKGEPLFLSDIKEEAVLFEFSMQWGVKSLIAVPMKVHGEVIGVYILTSKLRRAFSLDILDLIITIASETAVALEHKRLYGEMTRKISELSTLAEVSKSIVSTLDLNEILQLVVSLAKKMMNASGCACYLWEGENRLLLRALHCEHRMARKVMLPRSWVEKIQDSEMLVLGSRGSHEMTSLFIEGASYRAESEEVMAGTVVLVPLQAKGQALGVILVNLPEEVSDQECLVPLNTLAQQAASAIENAILYRDTRAMFVDTIQALVAAIDAKDAYTRGHSERVMRYARAISSEIGVSPEEEEIIAHAALLHDIGKIGINENILRKPNILTDGEFDALKDHPRIGSQILSHITSLKEVVPIIYHHHERFDGHGYMEGLKKEQVPLGARIVAVADSFEAMTSDRPYRRAKGVQEAKEELLKEAGRQFDPAVVEAFLRVLEKWEQELETA